MDTQNYMKLFVAQKMTRNNTLNKIMYSHDRTTAYAVAEYKDVWRGNRAKSLSDFVYSIVNWKNQLLEVEGEHVP